MARAVGAEEAASSVAVPPGGETEQQELLRGVALSDGRSRRALAEFRRQRPNLDAAAEGEVELLIRGRARNWITTEKCVEVLHAIASALDVGQERPGARRVAPSDGGPERRGRGENRAG